MRSTRVQCHTYEGRPRREAELPRSGFGAPAKARHQGVQVPPDVPSGLKPKETASP